MCEPRQAGLAGQTIVVTRPRDQAAGLVGLLRQAGADVIEAPAIEIAAVADTTRADDALRNLARYDWLVMTSANGVEATFNLLGALGLDAASLAGTRIAVVGPATADRLREHCIEPGLIAPEAVGESLAEALAQQGVRGCRVLLLRADISSPTLPDALRQAGAACDDIPVYRTVSPRSLPDIFLDRFDGNEIDWITFTSSSAFNNLLSLVGEERRGKLGSVRLASIGPVTTRAIRKAGYTPSAEANPHDAEGLVTAIIAAG